MMTPYQIRKQAWSLEPVKENYSITDFFGSYDRFDGTLSSLSISKSKELSRKENSSVFKVLKKKIEKEKDLEEIIKEQKAIERRKNFDKIEKEKQKLSKELLSLTQEIKDEVKLAKKLSSHKSISDVAPFSLYGGIRKIKDKNVSSDEPYDLHDKAESNTQSATISDTSTMKKLNDKLISLKNLPSDPFNVKKRIVFSMPKRSFPEMTSLLAQRNGEYSTRFPLLSVQNEGFLPGIISKLSNEDLGKTRSFGSPVRSEDQSSSLMKIPKSGSCSVLQTEKRVMKKSKGSNTEGKKISKTLDLRIPMASSKSMDIY